MRDSRAMTIVYRLKQFHKEFSNATYNSTSASVRNQLNGIKHPVYNTILTGWYGSQMISYIKQTLSKTDGADPVHLMSGFAKNDMKYENVS